MIKLRQLHNAYAMNVLQKVPVWAPRAVVLAVHIKINVVGIDDR